MLPLVNIKCILFTRGKQNALTKIVGFKTKTSAAHKQNRNSVSEDKCFLTCLIIEYIMNFNQLMKATDTNHLIFL